VAYRFNYYNETGGFLKITATLTKVVVSPFKRETVVFADANEK